MSYLAQDNEIQTKFRTSWGTTTPISWPNVDFTPPDGSWCRFSVNDGESGQIGLGSLPATIRYSGTIYIQIFTKQNIGTSAALTLADQAKLIFNNWCGTTVACYAARVKKVGNTTDGWYQVNVSIPFRRDENL